MSHRLFEIYRKIISVESSDVCNIHTDGGILYLDYDNPKFDRLLLIIKKDKMLIFDCIRKNKQFFIIDINRDKIRAFEATILDIEKEKYTENIHIITDPFRVLILNKNYTSYDKLYNKLKIGNTYLFVLSSNCNQLLDVKKPVKRFDYIEVFDVISHFNNNIEIRAKNSNIRFLHDSNLSIGCKYKITYSKSFGGNLYKIISSEIMA